MPVPGSPDPTANPWSWSDAISACPCVTLCVALDRSLLNSMAITDPLNDVRNGFRPIIPGESIKNAYRCTRRGYPNARAFHLLVNADAPRLGHEAISHEVTPLLQVSTTSLGDETNINARFRASCCGFQGKASSGYSRHYRSR